MEKVTNKEELIKQSTNMYEKLQNVLSMMTERELHGSMKIIDDSTRKEEHWSRDENVKDVLVHLFEWQQMLMHFTNENLQGNYTEYLPKPYTWDNYALLNKVLKQKHENTSLEHIQNLLDESHNKVMNSMQSFSNEELFEKNIFSWTGDITLAEDFINDTVAHYEWAINKLEIYVETCREKIGV